MVNSKHVLCCGARAWALVIGWFQSIFSGLAIVIFSLLLVILIALSAEHSNKADTGLPIPIQRSAPYEHQNTLRKHFNSNKKTLISQRKEFLDSLPFPLVGPMAVFLIISIINFVAGILLMTGVKQGKAGRLKAYIVSHTGFLFIFCIIVMVLIELTVNAFPLIIGFLISLFFIWVVNVHRKELLARIPVPVWSGRNNCDSTVSIDDNKLNK